MRITPLMQGNEFSSHSPIIKIMSIEKNYDFKIEKLLMIDFEDRKRSLQKVSNLF